MNAINRLKDYIDKKGIAPVDFEKSCGISNGYMGRQLQNDGSVGSHILERIALTYPELNMNWVIAGKGSMIMTQTKPSKEDEQATQKLEEQQAAYNTKNKAAGLIQEGLDLLNSALRKERASKKKY